MEESSRRIRRHVGFRWIVEALVGGDVNLEPSTFEPLLGDDRDPSIETKALTQRLKSRLKENRPILVGHNCFTDLIYFYQCFLGPLPDKVEEFISLIHQTFPIVVDTKYLATQEKDDGNPSTSLEELTKTLAKIRTPKIGMCFFFFTRG
jgi:poly(A)-specific ribonuclease